MRKTHAVIIKQSQRSKVRLIPAAHVSVCLHKGEKNVIKKHKIHKIWHYHCQSIKSACWLVRPVGPAHQYSPPLHWGRSHRPENTEANISIQDLFLISSFNHMSSSSSPLQFFLSSWLWLSCAPSLAPHCPRLRCPDLTHTMEKKCYTEPKHISVVLWNPVIQVKGERSPCLSGRGAPGGCVSPSKSDFCRLAIRDRQLTSYTHKRTFTKYHLIKPYI